ncbi:Presenilin-1 [Blomia tropicalis]|nr:Presenilin-1 [Blomia tropicalis]
MASSDHELSINSLTTSISETEDLSYDSKHKINQYIKLRKALERCSNELIHLMIPVLCTCTLTCILVSASCNNQSLQCYEGIFEKANKKHKHVELSYKELISQTMNVALDWFITVFLVFNISVTAFIAFIQQCCPLKLQQLLLIFFVINTSSLFVTILPPIATWWMLTIFAIWDLFAVLTPYGPTRWLLELTTKTKHNEKSKKHVKSSKTNLPNVIIKKKKPENDRIELPVFSVYRIAVQPDSTRKDSKLNDNCKVEISSQMGIGDFMCFSLLLGKTITTTDDCGTLIFVALSVIIGIVFTELANYYYRKPVPALPAIEIVKMNK